MKSMHEENLEKEISCKKEVNRAYVLHNINIEYISINVQNRIFILN